MQVHSLGYKTDLFFPRFDGEIIDHGDHISVRSPRNPTYHWGNFLLFDHPPASGDLPLWETLFGEEVGAPPVIEHVSFGWDSATGERGDAGSFVAAGYRLNESVVLTAYTVHRPPKYNSEIVARPIQGDSEWSAAVENEVAGRLPIYSEAGYREYRTRAMERHRAMADAGMGAWFGAFLGDQLAGDLGIFVVDGVGRFQDVGTHPDFRRRGICGTLVYHAARYAFDHLNARTLVMVADPEYHAAAIYESVGFVPTERQIGLGKFNSDA